MRKNLFLTGAIAILVLAFMGCENPTDYNVTLKPDGAAGVDASSIAIDDTLVDHTILVTWKDVDESGSYQVWRREIKDGEPVEGTAVVVGSGTYSPVKKIPYYQESATYTNSGTIYQYGIVANGYKTSDYVVQKSDIVWGEKDGNKTTATGKGPFTLTTVDPSFSGFTATLEAKTTQTSESVTSPYVISPNKLVATLKGLAYGYFYSVEIVTSNNYNPASSAMWISYDVFESVYYPEFNTSRSGAYLSIGQYVDQKIGGISPVFSINSSSSSPLSSILGYSYTPTTSGVPPSRAVKLRVTLNAINSNLTIRSHRYTTIASQAGGTDATNQYASVALTF